MLVSYQTLLVLHSFYEQYLYTKLAIAEKDKPPVKSLMKALESGDLDHTDKTCLLKQASIFLLLFQNILEFPIRSVAIDTENKKYSKHGCLAE